MRKATIVPKQVKPSKQLSALERAYQEGLIEEVTDKVEIKNIRDSSKPHD